MYPYLFGNEKIPTYGVCFFIGIVVTLLLLLFYIRKRSPEVNKDDSLLAACFALIGGIVGAKLLAILTSINYIVEYKPSFIDVMRNGFVFYGGLIGGFFGYFIYGKVYKIPVMALTDEGSQVLPLGHGIGRIGCFCAGCCYGRPTDSVIGVVYTHPSDPLTPTGVKLLPVQLFEAGFCLIVFIVLFILNKKRPLKRGINTTIYIGSYSIFRFINEFFRYDAERGLLLGLSTSQWISICLLIALGVYWFVINLRKMKESKN